MRASGYRSTMSGHRLWLIPVRDVLPAVEAHFERWLHDEAPSDVELRELVAVTARFCLGKRRAAAVCEGAWRETERELGGTRRVAPHSGGGAALISTFCYAASPASARGCSSRSTGR